MGDPRSSGIVDERPSVPVSLGTAIEDMIAPRATDEVLIRMVVAGDTGLFEELMLRHREHVGRIVGSHVAAAFVPEVAHDVFVRAYTGLATYAFEQPFAHWLATIAVRTCYDFWRSRRAGELPVSALTPDHQEWMDRLLVAQSDEQFLLQTRRREATEVLHWALDQLSPENRTVLTLVHLDGHSVREAAQLLGWSVINVKVRAHRARRALRKILMTDLQQGDHHANGR